MFKYMSDFFFSIFVKKSTVSSSIPLSRLEILESGFDQTLLELGALISKGPLYVLFHFQEYKSLLTQLECCEILIAKEELFLLGNPTVNPAITFNWAFFLGVVTVLLFILIGLSCCSMPGLLLPAAAKATNLSTALVIYSGGFGHADSQFQQVTGLLALLQQAIASQNWLLAVFYSRRIIVLAESMVEPTTMEATSRSVNLLLTGN